MLNRTILLKFVLKLIHSIFDPFRKFVLNTDKKILSIVNKINSQEFVFFTKGDHIANLNKVMLYISRNEHTKKIKLVFVKNEHNTLPKNLAQEVAFLDREYPDIAIELIIEDGVFSPELIKELSMRWKIPINFMFIGSPSDRFPYKIAELGGVRLII
jgi:hypothetical protein